MSWVAVIQSPRKYFFLTFIIQWSVYGWPWKDCTSMKNSFLYAVNFSYAAVKHSKHVAQFEAKRAKKENKSKNIHSHEKTLADVQHKCKKSWVYCNPRAFKFFLWSYGFNGHKGGCSYMHKLLHLFGNKIKIHQRQLKHDYEFEWN